MTDVFFTKPARRRPRLAQVVTSPHASWGEGQAEGVLGSLASPQQQREQVSRRRTYTRVSHVLLLVRRIVPVADPHLGIVTSAQH